MIVVRSIAIIVLALLGSSKATANNENPKQQGLWESDSSILTYVLLPREPESVSKAIKETVGRPSPVADKYLRDAGPDAHAEVLRYYITNPQGSLLEETIVVIGAEYMQAPLEMLRDYTSGEKLRAQTANAINAASGGGGRDFSEPVVKKRKCPNNC